MPKPADEFDQTSIWILPGILLLYFAVAFAQSAIKLLWADELITFYVARQPGWAGIWRALAMGADPNPPLIHVLVQASTDVFGASTAAIRLPGILCVLLALVSMWLILRRWVSPLFAASGLLAFMCTRGFDYSYDARSYAPLMGFAMAAFALWVFLPETHGVRRVVYLTGLAVALGLGISSNYYGLLAFFPIAAGEAMRNFERRRLGWQVWLAMLAGALPLFAYLPLIRHNIAEFAPHAWNRPRMSMVALSYFELVEGVFWPVLFLAIWAVWKRRQWSVPMPELIGLIVLMLYPGLGFLVALGGAGMISPRCVVPVCCGFGLALAILASHLFGQFRRAGIATVVLFLVWLCARESFCAAQLYQQRQSFFAVRDQLRFQIPESQVLVADSSLVLPLYFYSDAAARQIILFPIDFAAIHNYEKDDSGEQNLWAGRDGVFPFPILRLAAIPTPGNPFIVVARPDGWLAAKLRERGVTLTALEDREHGQWYGMGGIFTPMTHPETRFLYARPKQ